MSIKSKQSIATVVAPEASKELATAVISQKAPVAFRLSRFRDDQSGSTAMIFGLTLLPVVFFVGIAVDFSRGLTMRAKTQVALDAASLAAGRAYQTASSSEAAAAANPDAAVCAADLSGKGRIACAAAIQYWNTSKPTGNQAINSTLKFTQSTGAAQEFNATATTWLKTPFLNAVAAFKPKPKAADAPAGCEASGWQCMKLVSTASTLVAAGGGSDGVNLETALMIDVTGSMGPNWGDGNKLRDAKVAAKDLIDILVWDTQTTYTSKVSLVPFSKSVNVGTYASAVTGLAAASTATQEVSTGVCIEFRRNGNCRRYETTEQQIATALRPCVIERLGTNAATDEAPTATNGRIGSYAGTNAPSGSSYGSRLASGSNASDNYNADGTCDPDGNPQNNAAVVPLTTNKTTLKNTIDNMVASGGTAGHLGTAWAWYTLSPKWNSIWPTGSQPVAYNTANTNKIAILMTDGDYNQDYSGGDSSTSETKAGALCTAMKLTTHKITVYTVGFQVSDEAKTFLKGCATTHGHYYDATSGDALKQAFRDIALKISSLRISK